MMENALESDDDRVSQTEERPLHSREFDLN